MSDVEKLHDLLEQAYVAGWNASGEGYNAEHGIFTTEDEDWWAEDCAKALEPLKAAGQVSYKCVKCGKWKHVTQGKDR